MILKATDSVETAWAAGNYKRDLCVDFDGVLHSYMSGWCGPRVILDEPSPGALEWLAGLVLGDSWGLSLRGV